MAAPISSVRSTADDGTTPLGLWRRYGAAQTVTVLLPWAEEHTVRRALFEAGGHTTLNWDEHERSLTVCALPAERSAVLIAFGSPVRP